MGSDSDLPVMRQAAEVLELFGVKFDVHFVSAHRTPEFMFDFAKNAHTHGYKIIIAGAGGAAHLPGMVAALTPLPVIGVPVKSSNSLNGFDSLLSIVQMPSGVPVATVAVDGAKNAGLLAIQILGISDTPLQQKMIAYKQELGNSVAEKENKLGKSGYKKY